jgi:hypothetical protein
MVCDVTKKCQNGAVAAPLRRESDVAMMLEPWNRAGENRVLVARMSGKNRPSMNWIRFGTRIVKGM